MRLLNASSETILVSVSKPRKQAGHMDANTRSKTLPPSLVNRGPSTHGLLCFARNDVNFAIGFGINNGSTRHKKTGGEKITAC
jgi:hypothetical protein